jgi:hypothetical protein
MANGLVLPKTYVGDVGTIIYANCGRDISGATTARIDVIKPDETEAVWTGVVHTDNSSVKYTIQSGDLDQEGTYRCNVYVELTDWSGHGETFEFEVLSKGF